ncbi:MAG: hypothetical protein MI924_25535 [Chloroflexales bacterium]|nr:hypothetical protein [Chloroflexales bacterium]
MTTTNDAITQLRQSEQAAKAIRGRSGKEKPIKKMRIGGQLWLKFRNGWRKKQ